MQRREILGTVATPETFVTAMNDMWALKLPLLEKIARPIIIYFALIILLRVFGKRELAQLNPFDLVVLLSVSNTVQNAIIGDDTSVTGGLIGAAALFGINYVMVRFLFQYPKLDRVFEGSPTVLIRNGEVDRHALAKETLTESELLAVAHRQGFDTLQEIEYCSLEPGGAFFMKRHMPTMESERHEQLLARFEQIEQKLAQMEKRLE